MPRRISVAVALAAALVLGVGHAPVAACSFLPAELEDVASDVRLIFVAEVTDIPAPRTHVLEVSRTFRGPVRDSATYEPEPGTEFSTCEATLEVGSTYLFGTDSFSGLLGIGDVWFELDGEAVTGYSLAAWEGDVNALFAYLGGLPDTALPLPEGPFTKGARAPAGFALIGLAFVAALAQTRQAQSCIPRN